MLSRISRLPAGITLAAALSLSATSALAQNLFVSAGNGATPQLWTVDPAGVGSLVNFPAGTYLPIRASAFEVDQRTGHVLICQKLTPTSNITIHRTVIANAMVTSQTLLMTVPNTQNETPDYLYREQSGAFLLMSHSGSPFLDYRIHRIGITSTSGVAVEVPYLDVPSGKPMTDLCSDAAGTIYVTGPDFQTSVVWTVPAIGGPPAVVPGIPTRGMTFFSIETNAGGGLFIGGVPDSIGGPSLICPGGTSSVYGAAVGMRRRADGTMLLVDNLPGGSDVRTFPSTGCGAVGPGTFAWVAPSALVLFKATSADLPPSKLYGSPCAIGAGTVPMIAETSPPTIGTQWTVALTGAPPLTSTALFLGVAEIQPVLLTATCALFHSADTMISPITTDAAGAATFSQATPNDISLIGYQFFVQWGVFDATAPSGLAVTSAVATAIDLPTM